MLPTSRVVSALLLGVGVAGLSAGLATPTFIEAEPTLPLDLEHTTWTMTDENATTRLLQDGRQLQVPVTAQWHIALQEPADDEQVTLRVGSSWMRSSMQEEKDRLITAQVWSYPIDRLTGDARADAAVSHTMASPVSTVPVTGLWWKFPAGAEKTSYDVFDETLRDSAPAVFEEEMEMDGRTVYRYHQDIEPTNVAKKYNNYQTMLSGEDGTEYLFHSAQRDFYVDKISGMIVDLDVSSRTSTPRTTAWRPRTRSRSTPPSPKKTPKRSSSRPRSSTTRTASTGSAGASSVPARSSRSSHSWASSASLVRAPPSNPSPPPSSEETHDNEAVRSAWN